MDQASISKVVKLHTATRNFCEIAKSTCTIAVNQANMLHCDSRVQIVRTIPVWLGMKMVMMFMTPDNSKKKIKGLLLPILQNKNANKYQVMLTSTNNKVFYAFNYHLRVKFPRICLSQVKL